MVYRYPSLTKLVGLLSGLVYNQSSQTAPDADVRLDDARVERPVLRATGAASSVHQGGHGAFLHGGGAAAFRVQRRVRRAPGSGGVPGGERGRVLAADSGECMGVRRTGGYGAVASVLGAGRGVWE